ncbi:Ger(x)C family spore germination protein [Paenibacillus sp. MZ04-78.2]|uniref:Ger(x)C family spore germination protein n=1 Tax=Paenibacillus sp. MZ04-78.2 TaxID=2962034 RepID=UPI0020B84675|nr:Ger(x)C family spore germination protein [Paenibacillus sp. MZ04-78.2]MCP3773798.1 Ger(x)C family spore germination protein [Paenibacillus sp. MZ04-78.2]
MKRKKMIIPIVLLLIMIMSTGCWDRRELNDQAINIALGFDRNEDGTYQGAAQFAIPAKMGSGDKGSQSEAYFSVSGKGKNMYETVKDMQLKVSRTWFAGHRRVILIGERLAKHGLSNILDEFSRDPNVRMRTDMIVLKGGSVKEFLELSYPLERLLGNALVKMHESAGLNPDLTLRNFLMAAAGEESSPYLPVIEKAGSSSEADSEEASSEMKLWGFAIFNKDSRFVEYLPMKKSFIRQWIAGQLQSNTFTVNIPGEKGNIAVEAYHLKSKIGTSRQGDQVYILVTLSGKGNIRENNTRLDLTDTKNIKLVEKELNKQTAKYVKNVIQKVQPLGTDIFGFGEAFHRQHPYAWKELKKDWIQKFARAEVSVKSNLHIQEVGLTGPSGILKKHEIKK